MKKLAIKRLAPLVLAACVSLAHANSYDEFFSAVVNNNADAVSSLLQRGFDPNTPSPEGQRPLFLALRAGSLKSADVLLQQPTLQVDAINLSNETPMMMAALRGELRWCERLHAKGAAVNRAGWTPLHYAASGPQPQVVAWLLERGADIEARSPNATTPLMMAAGYGDEGAVDVLLARGANVKARNDVGWSAVEFARNAGRDRLADRLAQAARR